MPTDAPEFALPDGQGEIVRLRDYRGQAVVLFFIRAFTCRACQQHARQLASVYQEFRQRATEVIVVGPGQPQEAAHYRDRLALPFPVVADPVGATARRFGVDRWLFKLVHQTGLIVVDAAGQMRYTRVQNTPAGVLDLDALWSVLDDEVHGDPPTPG
jgi:peroxiredoxin